MNVSGIILSAGESTRMGSLKQLLPFGQKTVMETVIGNFLQADLYEIIVVLGHQAEQISRVLGKSPIKRVINEKYKDGMLSSVQRGIEATDENTEAFLIGLGDQPFVPASVIIKLLESFRECGKGIVIPSYNKKRGHPIVIHAKYRDEISHLDTNVGLRQLVYEHEDDLAYVDVPSDEVIRDMDFPEDYERELKRGEI
jgi:molybdenum cofactor cytidylyltransferase